MIKFTDDVWQDHVSWQREDKKILKCINRSLYIVENDVIGFLSFRDHYK